MIGVWGDICRGSVVGEQLVDITSVYEEVRFQTYALKLLLGI